MQTKVSTTAVAQTTPKMAMRIKNTFFSQLVLVIGLAIGSVAPLGASASSLPGLPGLQLAPLQSKAPLSFAFVDASLPDARQLQSAAAAASAAEPGTFHLFSHGRPGQLLINGQWLGAPEIAAWLRQSGLPEGTEQLNLYGCEFAQGEAGAQAVAYLEEALGIPVAASTNITGRDGDWVLEVGSVTQLGVTNYSHNLQDADGDGVLNRFDLDSDNDGILDTVEKKCGGSNRLATWTHNDFTYAASNVSGFIASASDSTAGSGLSRSISANYSVLTGVAATSLAQARTNNEYVHYNFTTNSLASFTFRSLSTYSVYNPGTVPYTIGIDISTDNFSTFTNIVSSQSIPSGYNDVNNYNPTYQLEPSTAYSMRVYFFNAGGTIEYDDYRVTVCTDADTDIDGIPDFRDLDSDADGCADAIEGGGSFTAANLSGGRLTGGVQANGVPTVAGAGQTEGDSLVATQVLVNGANPANQNITTVPSAASFAISTTATNTTVFSAGTPQYGSGSSADASTVYRWYLGDPDSGGTLLTNTGVYSGTTSATLGISNVNNLIGNTYFVVATQTNQQCVRLKRSAQLLSTVVDLSITKTNNLPGTVDLANDTLARGQSTTYQIVVTNNGPQSVTGAVVTDSATGLTCSGSVSCSATPAGACPALTPTAAQLLGAGVTLQALPVGGTATLNLACTVN